MAKRLSLEVSDELYEWLKSKAEREEVCMTDIFRKGFAVLKSATKYVPLGYHLGFTSDPKKLDVMIVGM